MFAAMLLLFMMIIIQSIESLAKKKNLQIFSICVKLKKNQVLGASKAHLQSENQKKRTLHIFFKKYKIQFFKNQVMIFFPLSIYLQSFEILLIYLYMYWQTKVNAKLSHETSTRHSQLEQRSSATRAAIIATIPRSMPLPILSNLYSIMYCKVLQPQRPKSPCSLPASCRPASLCQICQLRPASQCI